MNEAKRAGIVKVVFVVALICCLSGLINSPVALVLGFFFTYFLGHPFASINQRLVNWFLKIAVVGIGFGLNIQEAINVSKHGFFLTISTIALVLILGYLLGKLLKVEKKTTHLISSGTAICGGSAIAAVAPIIGGNEKDISISLGVVFLLNSLALLTFPFIGYYFQLSEYQFGLWCAVAIHDTSSVVGAASTYGSEALEVATTVKMARILWIIPLSLVSLVIFKGKNQSLKVPWFILLFVGAILLTSYVPIESAFTSVITDYSKRLLVLTLFLVGAGLSVDRIKSAGWQSMTLGFLLWICVSVFSLVYILS